MQIYNNAPNMNFRGELIITQKGKSAIKRCNDSNTLKKLVDTKKDIKESTEMFDIEVGNNLECKIRSIKDAFFGVFESSVFSDVHKDEQTGALILDNKYGIHRYPIADNENEVRYNVWSMEGNEKLDTAEHIDILLTIAQEMDKAAVAEKSGTLSENINRKACNKYRKELLG